MTATTPSNPQPGSGLGTLRNQAGHCPTCSPIPAAAPTPSSTSSDPGNSAAPVDVEQSTSRYHPRRRATLDERRRVGDPLPPSTSGPAFPRRRRADEPPPSTSVERLQRPQRPCADEPPAFLVADEPPRRAPPSSATPSNRRAPPPSSTSRFSATQPPGSDNGESPSGALLRGFTWVRRQATKPDTSAGQAAVSAIPDPKPVSGGANSPTVAAGVLCSADQIVPPQSLRTAATVSDIELHGADPVRSQSRAQQ